MSKKSSYLKKLDAEWIALQRHSARLRAEAAKDRIDATMARIVAEIAAKKAASK